MTQCEQDETQKDNMAVRHETGFRWLTSCATKKAKTSKNPGRSTNDQLRDRVTKIRAWLIVLTWRYTADASFWKSSWAVFSRLSTWNSRCKLTTMIRMNKLQRSLKNFNNA
jgi:hypothetical protein